MSKLTWIKATLLLGLMAFILILFPSQKNAPKELTVKGTLPDWQNVFSSLEQSNAPHLQVEAAKTFILTQINKQLADTSKPKK